MQKKRVFKPLKITGLLLLVCQLLGCTTQNRDDPLENLNRGTYRVNKILDRVVIKPLAHAYDGLLPKFIRIPIGNFFQNLSEVPNVANDLFQGEFSLARHDTARFILNTSWGLGGLLDVAATGGLERHRQDFGITMARWGYKESAYFVIPIFGPSTIRDTVGRITTYYMSISAYIPDVKLRNGLFVLNVVDTRAALLKAEPAIDEAVDEYVFIRNAYFQHRRYQFKQSEDNSKSGQESALEGPPE
jgi:phospholipid-binding lipoprotein MlaA